MITNQDIQKLISTPKKIQKKNPRRGYTQEKGHKKCNLILCQLHLQMQDSAEEKSPAKKENLKEQNNDIEFKIFIRQNQTFMENFSIGLRCYISSLQKFVILVRYNGPHGSVPRGKTDHHPYPHIHRVTQEEIQSGSFNPKEKNIEITKKYSTYEEGLRAFLMDMNVTNWQDYFPELEQMRFF